VSKSSHVQSIGRRRQNSTDCRGTSSGIGAEFAQQLAARGPNLILVARSIEKLDAAAASLRATYHVDILTVKLDLSTRDASERLFRLVAEQSLHVIINIAGTGAFQPAPYMAARTASAAFVLSFTQAVSAENADTGVRIFALWPGPTQTPMTRGQESPLGKMRTPTDVVTTALKALDSSNASVIDGRLNAFVARVGSRLPESMILTLAARIMKRSLVSPT
jgi:uncharacterized protein